MSQFQHTGQKVLLTEGKNDCFVICSLCKLYNVPENFGLYDCGSDDKALRRLSALISSSEPPLVIGIVLDADNPNLQSKWESIKNRLIKSGYIVPDRPETNGTIIDHGSQPKIGVWLMPDNNIDGMLEDFCRTLVNGDAIDFAQTCAEQARLNGYTTFKEAHLSKSTIHTFLAWQDEPGMPLGQAITARTLDATKPTAQNFINFLVQLYR